MYTAFYACVYIYRRRRQEVRKGDFESKTEISLSCQLIAGKNYIQYLYTVYKWIYTVYIYTRTVTVSSQSIRSLWRSEKNLGVSTTGLRENWKELLSLFPATLLILKEFLWKNENTKVKWIQVGWSRPQLCSAHKSKFGSSSQIVIQL